MLCVCIDPVFFHLSYAAHVTFFLIPLLSTAELNCGYDGFDHRDARTLYLVW